MNKYENMEILENDQLSAEDLENVAGGCRYCYRPFPPRPFPPRPFPPRPFPPRRFW